MSLPAAFPITYRGLVGFGCVGERCEDNCCHSRNVPYSRADFERLERTMSGTEEERATFASSFQVHAPGAPGRRYASLRQVGSMCTFLTPSKLCGLHFRYGEAALSEVCATYPRKGRFPRERVEVWAALSCPEVARKSLLAADAMDMVAAPEHLLASLRPPADAPAEVRTAAFIEQLDEVRGWVLGVLSQRDYPLSARLASLASACHRSATFYHVRCDAPDGERLRALFAGASTPEALAAFSVERPREVAALPRAAIGDAVSLTLSLTPRSSLRRLIVQSLQDLGDVAELQNGRWTPGSEDFWVRLHARQASLQSHHAAQVDLYLENYSKHHWCTGWDDEARNLWDHVRGLLFRVLSLRFLLSIHPALAAMDAARGADGSGPVLDRTIVDVVYRYCRAIDHGDCGASLRQLALARTTTLQETVALTCL